MKIMQIQRIGLQGSHRLQHVCRSLQTIASVPSQLHHPFQITAQLNLASGPYEFIKSVKFSNIENTSSNTFYSNYIGDTAKIYVDKSYQLTLTPGFSGTETYPETWHVFIDWNQDGDFKDAKEILFAGVSEQAMQVEITPPASAKKGMTKMRVTMDYLGGSNDACKEVDSGEVEDYLLYVK